MARKKSAKAAKGGAVKIPSLAGVTTAAVLSKGWHKARITAVETGEGDKAAYFKWTFEVIAGKSKGKQPKPFFTSLADNALFNLKGLLEAVGFKIPKKGFNLDPETLVGEELFIHIDHELYEGRTQNIVTMVSDEEPEDDDDDEDEDEDADEDDDEDEDGEDGDEDEDEDGEEEEDEDEVELTADEIKQMTTEELKDLCEEHELDINFKKVKTLKAQRTAVAKAAKAEGLI